MIVLFGTPGSADGIAATPQVEVHKLTRFLVERGLAQKRLHNVQELLAYIPWRLGD